MDDTPSDFYENISDEECDHENTYVNDNGDGYCTDCGRNIIAGMDINKPCDHKKRYKTDTGTHVCRDCNEEIDVLSEEAEWRYYDSSCRDPTRCHQKTNSRNLSKTLGSIDIPKSIKNAVEKDFYAIVGNDTLRGKNRAALIAVCTFYAYYFAGYYKPINCFREMFNVSQREMSNKLKMYQEYNPKAIETSIGPEELVIWVCELIGIDDTNYDSETLNKIMLDMRKIWDYIKNTSKDINRSTPKSVASAIVYFYLCINPQHKNILGINRSSFSKMVKSSEITIDKLTKEISRITGRSLSSNI